MKSMPVVVEVPTCLKFEPVEGEEWAFRALHCLQLKRLLRCFLTSLTLSAAV